MGETLRAQNEQRRSGKAPGADNWRELQATCASYLDAQAMDKICRAYEFARECHGSQRRRSGEPYINHPVDVALILASLLHMDEEPICAAILHDTVEDTDATLEDLAEQFGQTVADLVDGVTKLTQVQVSSLDEKQAFNLRKMFLAMSKDIRVIVIKLADRLHNMRTMAALPPEKRIIKSRETMDVYAPLADRLGISSIKWELEDLAFFYLKPEEYERIARMVQESRAQREEKTAEAIRLLEEELAKEGITDVQISGRPKHLWSIYQKMTRKRKEFSQIYDLIALRVLTETVADCYSVLGAVHSLWHPIPGRFKDYVAMPKANGYQSLHTTVIGAEVGTVEIQIRTYEMHDKAEYGIAAHWLYKRSGNSRGEMSAEDRSVDTQINWIRRTLDWTTEEEIEDPHEFLNSLRVDLFEHEIFVFTPKGDVMSLRREATPLDFAYAVHTDVGNHCTGAKVNGVMVPLTHKLQSGDRVEIITNKNAKPGHDWLKMVVTPSARAKIRKYFATATKEDDAERGRGYLAVELRRYGLGVSSARVAKALEKVCESSDYHDVETMLAAVGTGRMSAKQLAHKVSDVIAGAKPAGEVERQERKATKNAAIEQDKPLLPHKTRDRSKRQSSCGVVAKGDPDLLVHLAHCCNPVAGDEIVGFVTRGRGVRVHRANCPNLTELMKHPERLIDVEWDTSGATEFQVEIVVEATDRMGLLKDVTIALDEAGGYILSAATQSGSTGVARLRFLIALSDASLLGPLLARVNRVPSVYDARRILPGEGAKQLKRRA